MNAFEYVRPERVDDALLAARQPGARFIGGGTNLLDLMKGGVETPTLLIDINALPLAAITATPSGGLTLGALVRNSALADHPRVRTDYPLMSRALVAGASGQLRNMATVGGNLMQRTRCGYFYDTAFAECNKRRPGSGCAARDGENRNHAILGASAECVATHPSDLCVALVALDGVVNVVGPAGARHLPMDQFHRLPGSTPERDTNLAAGEMIESITLPASPFARHHAYLKVRDRASYAFALVAVAVGLELDAARQVQSARIVLGGVAHKPWRAAESEALLVGRTLDGPAIAAAARAAVAGARPLAQNGFKVDLAERAVERALRRAGSVA